MDLHLAEIAIAVAPGAHAVILLDQAGWHTSKKLTVPTNITLMPLPPKCPELNPTENIWQTVCSLQPGPWLSNIDPLVMKGVRHAEGYECLCRSRHIKDENLGGFG
jgi:hypothetical protein